MYKETSQNSCVSGVDHRGTATACQPSCPPIQYGAAIVWSGVGYIAWYLERKIEARDEKH